MLRKLPGDNAFSWNSSLHRASQTYNFLCVIDRILIHLQACVTAIQRVSHPLSQPAEQYDTLPSGLRVATQTASPTTICIF
jgi:hypothetical protein